MAKKQISNLVPRRRPTLKAIYEKASAPWSTCLNPPGVCGDGWNSYDCVVCMAKARRRHLTRKDGHAQWAAATKNHEGKILYALKWHASDSHHSLRAGFDPSEAYVGTYQEALEICGWMQQQQEAGMPPFNVEFANANGAKCEWHPYDLSRNG